MVAVHHRLLTDGVKARRPACHDIFSVHGYVCNIHRCIPLLHVYAVGVKPCNASHTAKKQLPVASERSGSVAEFIALQPVVHIVAAELFTRRGIYLA